MKRGSISFNVIVRYKDDVLLLNIINAGDHAKHTHINDTYSNILQRLHIEYINFHCWNDIITIKNEVIASKVLWTQLQVDITEWTFIGYAQQKGYHMCNRKCFPVIPDFRGGRVAQLIIHVFYVACFGHCFPYVVILFLPCRSQFLKSHFYLSPLLLLVLACTFEWTNWLTKILYQFF